MGQTKKRKYDRYILAFKIQAGTLANHPDVKSKDVAESLGIHPVMLYRWQMEARRGELRENKSMKTEKPSPERRPTRADPTKVAEEKLAAAERRIKKLERQLAQSDDEIDLLKKAERFFQWKK
ncbi:transposase [Alloalcanivorax gelatiniphagus]|uniref:transposase n=1 Tax=Alloalcanivorax gelatiniphagus TaxID=1194167 RepID=UPI001F0E0677|nr:transposase [Alloalcanivorax gelatiniphagus]